MSLSSSKKKKNNSSITTTSTDSSVENNNVNDDDRNLAPTKTSSIMNTQKNVPRVQSSDAFFLGKGDFLKVGEEPFQPDPDDPSIRPFRSGFELDKKSFEQKDVEFLDSPNEQRRPKTPEQLISLQKQKSSILPALLNCSGVVQDACNAIVDDSFNRCFQMKDQRPWNFNFYLYPLWVVGFIIRHCILLPLRFTWLVLSLVLFFLLFFIVHYTLPEKRAQVVK